MFLSGQFDGNGAGGGRRGSSSRCIVCLSMFTGVMSCHFVSYFDLYRVISSVILIHIVPFGL